MKSFILSILMVSGLMVSSYAPALAADKEDKAHTHCDRCAKICENNAKKLERKSGDAKLIQTLKDCAKSCRSHNAGKTSGADCKTACASCAQACEKSGDEMLKSCVKTCSTCAQHCGAAK